MQRMRTVNQETRRIYNSFILEHSARTGIELVLNKLRLGSFSSGPYEASVAEGIRYVSYVDTTGIGLVGQKICQVFSRAESNDGSSLLMMATVEVYPRGKTPLIIPHSFYVIEKDLFINTFSARQSLLNFKNLQHNVFVQQLRSEAKLSMSEYRQNLKDLEQGVPPELKKHWNSIIVPEIISRKITN